MAELKIAGKVVKSVSIGGKDVKSLAIGGKTFSFAPQAETTEVIKSSDYSTFTIQFGHNISFFDYTGPIIEDGKEPTRLQIQFNKDVSIVVSALSQSVAFASSNMDLYAGYGSQVAGTYDVKSGETWEFKTGTAPRKVG